MQINYLRRPVAIALALAGNVALAQSGWVEMTSTGSGGLKNLPVNDTYDANRCSRWVIWRAPGSPGRPCWHSWNGIPNRNFSSPIGPNPKEAPWVPSQ